MNETRESRWRQERATLYRRQRTVWAVAAATVCTLALAPTAAEPQSRKSSSQAETPQIQAPQVIQSNVRRVVVDVVVTDSKGSPVRGLLQRDFSVYEDGVAQQTLSFQAHSTASAEFVPPHLPPLPPNWYVDLPSGPEGGPLYVILLDLLHTDKEDQPRMRKEVEDFLAAKPEGMRFAIFALTNTLHLVQGFTANRNKLVSAVAPETSRLPYIFLDANRYLPYVSAPGALIDIGRFLAGFPGRKNLIWMAGDFPYYMLIRPGLYGANSLALMNPLADEERKEATDVLTRAQVSVYPVDAEGLVVYRDIGESNSSHMFEDNFAEQTGGRAFYNSNDIPGFLDGVADADSNYYELTYSPPNPSEQNKLRHIKVAVAGRGLHLEYRRSYYLSAWNKQVPTVNKRQQQLLSMRGVLQPENSLYVYMQHGAPMAHGLLFAAHVQSVGATYRPSVQQRSALAEQPAYFRGVGKKPDWRLGQVMLQNYAVDFRISAAQFPSADKSTTLEIALVAFDKDGVMLNSAVEDADTSASQAQKDRVYTLREQIDVPSSAAWLRFAVRDNSSGRIGATEIPLPLEVQATQ